MKIDVEKIYQSPTTPVYELQYLIKISEYDVRDDPEINKLVKYLEHLIVNSDKMVDRV